jgi:hypothetical protein
VEIDPRLGPLPDWLSAILEDVLSDFQQPVVIDLLVGYDAAGQAVWFSEPGETSRASKRRPPARRWIGDRAPASAPPLGDGAHPLDSTIRRSVVSISG